MTVLGAECTKVKYVEVTTLKDLEHEGILAELVICYPRIILMLNSVTSGV